MDTSSWLTLVMWATGVAAMAGMYVAGQKALKKDIIRLETKVDKHNCFMERLAVVENEIKNIKENEK
jgi:hypothetical protein